MKPNCNRIVVAFQPEKAYNIDKGRNNKTQEIKKVIVLLTAALCSSCGCTKSDGETASSGTSAEISSPPTVMSDTSAPVSPPLTSAAGTEAVTESYGEKIVRTAEALIGVEFAEGGASPAEGFDNSGFIYYVMRENGFVSFPRLISEQVDWGAVTDYSGIKAGDLLYFSSEEGENASLRRYLRGRRRYDLLPLSRRNR